MASSKPFSAERVCYQDLVFLKMKKVPFALLLVFALMSCRKDPATQTAGTLPELPAATGQIMSVTINQNQPGDVIAPAFEGLSYETGILPKQPAFLNASNMVLIQLIKNLGSGILRIGGNSSDQTYWTGKARTGSTGTDSLTTTEINNLTAFAKATGWQVLFGLNLGSYNTAAAANEAHYVSTSLQNSLYAFQTGNEPDLYYNNGHRSASYSYSNYQTEWNSYFSAVRGSAVQTPFAGPDIADNTKWVASFTDNEHANVKLIDGHYYNSGPASDPAITYQTLLALNKKLPVYLQSLNSSSSKYGLPYRISECNSVYDGGKTGVSNAFASALWALDFMWQVAQNNGQGVNFHGGNSGAYTPIALSNNLITAMPEYYAMLSFKYGSNGGTLVPAALGSTAYNCSAYACISGTTTYITLINKDAIDLSFNLQLVNPASSVQVARLTAPSITSTTGVTFAGSGVSADGTYKQGVTEKYAISGKTFAINVPAGSAAVLTLQ